jgi:hypothetical protein
MTTEELKELIKKLVQEYTGTGSSGGNATDGNDIPSPRPFADDEEELEDYLFKNVYGGEGGHYRRDKYTGNYPNRDPRGGMFELKNYIKKYLKEQATPAELAQDTRKKNALQKQIIQIDIDRAKKNKVKASMTTAQQMATTVEPLDQVNKTIFDARKEKVKLNREERKLEREIEEINKLELGVDITQEQKTARLKEIEEQLTTINQQQEQVEQTIDGAIKQKEGIMDQRNSINQAASQQASAADDAIDQLEDSQDNVGKQQAMQEIKADDYGSATLTTQGQYKSRFTKTGKPPGIMDEMNTCPKCGKMGHDASHHKHDHEGKMAKSQLYKIHQYAERLLHMLPDDAQLPAWVQSKFTNAAHSIGAAFHYLDYETMAHHDNLMENMDFYKREALMEGTMKKFFRMFDEGKTNEEVLRHYAGRGVSIPETFLSKARKQYENLKKQKLEIEFAEQEAKDFKPTSQLQIPAEESKKLSSRLYKEKLDPVGKEDGDIDNDGDEDETDKYLLKKRKAISKAIKKQKKKK